jgi:hypothetical protein
MLAVAAEKVMAGVQQTLAVAVVVLVIIKTILLLRELQILEAAVEQVVTVHIFQMVVQVT